MDKLIKGLFRILDEDLLFPVYQPIASVEGREIAGYESFVRGPADSAFYAPRSLYLAAELAGSLLPLEYSATRAAIQQFRRLGLPGRLFKRFPPHFFASALFAKGVKGGQWDSFAQVGLVASLVDHRHGGDSELLRRATKRCRENGIAVALDELLTLSLPLRILRELAPDFLFIDGHYIQGIQDDPSKQRLVQEVRQAALAVDAPAQLIAQGVETAEEFFTIRRLGVPLAQGYYLGRPDAHPAVALSPRLFVSRTERPQGPTQEADRVGQLVRALAHIPPTEPTGEVLHIFLRNPMLSSLPVVYQGAPVGMIRRERLANLFLTPFGRDLYAKAPILRFMDDNPLVVERDDSIERVSQRIIERGQAQENGDFVISNRGLYLGVGRVVDVLRRITEMQIRDASHANPLSGLPGNVRIQEEVERRLQAGEPFTACYFDLDNFKPFNDRYGYQCGDDVIRALAGLLKEAADPDRDFLGHVGGDDFILLFASEEWEARCRQVLERFGELAPRFYNKEDRRQEGIRGKDRQGKELFFGFLALSIGAVQPSECKSHHCVAAMAAEAKKQAKKTEGNSLFLERRRRS